MGKAGRAIGKRTNRIQRMRTTIPRLLPPALALAALAWAGWYFSAQPGQPTPPPAQYRRLSPEQLDSLWRETVRQGREPRLSHCVTKSPLYVHRRSNLRTRGTARRNYATHAKASTMEPATKQDEQKAQEVLPEPVSECKNRPGGSPQLAPVTATTAANLT